MKEEGMEKEMEPSGTREPKTALGVGDWVRILPMEEGFLSDGVNITEEMVGMVGALYRVEAVDRDLATVNGWAFRLGWLQRYLPEAAVLPPAGLPAAPRALEKEILEAIVKMCTEQVLSTAEHASDYLYGRHGMAQDILKKIAVLSSVAEGPVRSAEPESNPSNSEVAP
ncbi:MAG: hypothetical protein A3E01_06555 [Gammaproteobacteria bacterium RIFCSPHIGHO2_12_FULL_63_22]|nr:MAG: hypothetical protein A3E01_06555 [Gammaproteobacteria bacterium RIFCSPHIGHO2_12_FULL_63_22]